MANRNETFLIDDAGNENQWIHGLRGYFCELKRGNGTLEVFIHYRNIPLEAYAIKRCNILFGPASPRARMNDAQAKVWFRSNLTDCYQFLSSKEDSSLFAIVQYVVQKDSIFSPRYSSIFISSILDIICIENIGLHFCVYDTQVYMAVCNQLQQHNHTK